ncbi:unnamed protein product [Polarella glacialis]|uniref:Calmodulin-lysine N-methyltransferase n=1 Tax=Polarella glacialis TaxID=89957 RepID=A0A813H487_POLGL|nr:unnamed protein product [Polarella glacialis]
MAEGRPLAWGDFQDAGPSVQTELALFKATVPTTTTTTTTTTSTATGLDEGRDVATAQIHLRHVPRTVQSACDPGLAHLEKALGLHTDSSSDDLDPIWEWGHVGVHLYPSALLLAQYLLARDGCALVKDRRVLELGCGAGVLGPVSVLAGASQVVLTDFDPLVLDLCQHNQRMNRPALLAARPGAPEVSVSCFDWRELGDGAPRSLVADVGKQEGARCHSILAGVDVVLASDVVYDDGISAALGSVLAALFRENPAAVGLLAVQYREDDALECNGSAVERWLQVVAGPSEDKVEKVPQQNHGQRRDGRDRSRCPPQSKHNYDNKTKTTITTTTTTPTDGFIRGVARPLFSAHRLVQGVKASEALACISERHSSESPCGLSRIDTAIARGAAEFCGAAELELWLLSASAPSSNHIEP